ncbi:hypothetical protein EJ05DRAFT_65528 [Pseudovirgaria hyperparasitica]|uniref:Uncharacterized protein n=1 Tax=Pseudovirgaria hyperparasitica TaxID=470096 RepID=A0A6A6W370_9PEZI|nr:uncharacterized protein EJ05DRAFT_65528 [Pseudovirgaria hyperparasitica]KAF2756464.1 hypothetical protein EJ05DRAFT_65528 [Pseudovirgaria hyperparasitica]
MKRSPDQVSVRTSVDVLDEVKRHPARSDFSSPERNPSKMLPSPTSLNFPALQAPSFASSAGGAPTAAQAVHIQDLQRELSVKTLEYQSLRQEYDRLLQKLERERIRCATFENKAAVGEIEMNSAVTERDQVQAQVALLEVEIEKLQESRDEERRKSAASGSQYMKMVALSNQIQARNAEEKARWLVEKQTMERRLEGQSPDAPNTLVSPVLQPYNMSQDPDAHNEPLEQRKGHSDSEHKFGRYRHLSQENTRLNSRVSALEQALRSVRSESRAVHAALQSIAASSGANRELIDSLLDDG